MAMMDHTWGFTSRIVSGVPVLFCLILVRTLIGTSINHDVRWDGVERYDQQITPVHGTNDEQGRDKELSLLTSTGSTRPA